MKADCVCFMEEAERQTKKLCGVDIALAAKQKSVMKE